MELLHALAALFFLTFSAVPVNADSQCIPKSFGYDSIVCVCNATYCDEFETVTHYPSGKYLLYTSTKDGLRFKKSVGSFSPRKGASCLTLQVDRGTKYQTVKGFGTAFTDSAGINVFSLSPDAQQNLMRSYFTSSGISLNMGRVPIAGCDFSIRGYTYDDYENDTQLTKFNLTWEDYKLKMPLIKWAQNLRNQTLKLKAAAWSPPIWMKTNYDLMGASRLLDQYYQTWADYHIKFLDAYKENGIEFWAVSTGNEPANGIVFILAINSLGWTPQGLLKWTVENLGPSLRASQHSNVKILVLDDQRPYVPWVLDKIMDDKRMQKYVDGIAVHWYYDEVSPAQILTETQKKYPTKFIISTEASIVTFMPNVSRVRLGDWSNGEAYMTDMIQDFTHWVTGWYDWNLALDQEGGPNWVENYVDSSIIVNAKNDEFYKQPLFYALGHFSKFIHEDSVRIDVVPNNKNGIRSVAFTTPYNATALVISNKRDHNTKVTIADPDRGYITIKVPKRSFNTLLYW
ncbi:lysosomal acid glucosylceramidase-like [Schistocerca gregaria]|uniref:lysosomal acid glucosylceramidase-like n=1 Tax=Schistocerca gregaria TaxID=7010 RepID=UPI00211EBDDD|nr:lysosomal acid glucosylceramidase-like [Schistocerca gregaria]XP_049830164.1 lysosomal acid glucosylceramidase-like [Schistocerca gregaria]